MSGKYNKQLDDDGVVYQLLAFIFYVVLTEMCTHKSYMLERKARSRICMFITHTGKYK